MSDPRWRHIVGFGKNSRVVHEGDVILGIIVSSFHRSG